MTPYIAKKPIGISISSLCKDQLLENEIISSTESPAPASLNTPAHGTKARIKLLLQVKKPKCQRQANKTFLYVNELDVYP